MSPYLLSSSLDTVSCRRHGHASALDMLRSETRIVTAMGPADFGGIDRVSERLRTWASLGPAARLGLRASPTSRRWAYRPELILDDVAEIPAFPREELEQQLARLSRDRAVDVPFRARLAGDYLLLDLSHGLSDALLPVEISAYLADPRPDAPLPRWTRDIVISQPLLPTLASWVVSHPRKVLDMAYGRFRPIRAGAFVAPPEVYSASAEETRPWSRSPAISLSSSQVGFVDRVRQWRKETGEAASISAIIASAVSTSLKQSGIDLASSVTFLFDCRRYLPSNTSVLGNFAAGLDFPATDPTSLPQLQFALTSAIDKGRPIAAAALSSLKYKRTGRPMLGTETDRVAVDPSARLIFSDLGRIRSFEHSAWTAQDGERALYGLSEPAGPESIVITTQQVNTVIYISASFHDNVFDPATVRAALDAVTANPLDLLNTQESTS